MSYSSHVFYRDTSSAEPKVLPGWANFCWELGSEIVRSHTAGSRRVVALSVPIRSFCSPLIAAGAITQMAADFIPIDTTILQHFETLKALPNGTHVRRTVVKSDGTKGRKYGIKVGYEPDMQGKPCVGFRTERGSKKKGPVTDWLSPELCKDVSESLTDAPNLPINSKFKTIRDGQVFWSSLLHDIDGAPFYAVDSIECLIIGPLKFLEEEIRNNELLVAQPSTEDPTDRINEKGWTLQYTSGSLQDILRVKEYDSTNSGYKSDISSLRNNPEVDGVPRLVLFDGAQAFMKWYYLFKHSDWVVILDRTEPNYRDGLLRINDDFINRSEDLKPELDVQCPYGMDMMAYVGDIR